MSLLQDVNKLKGSCLPEVKETIAYQITQYFNRGIFDEEEVKIAGEIIRLLSQDVDVRIRQIVAENLKTNPNLPYDVAVNFARDLMEVALPVLEFSSVLKEDDIIMLVQSTQNVAKLAAISRRNDISITVADQLLASRNEEVVVSLFSNQYAQISDNYVCQTLEEFRHRGDVLERLVHQGNMPMGIAEKMLKVVSGELYHVLVQKYCFSNREADELICSSHEKAILTLLTMKAINDDKIDRKIRELTEHLYYEERLTHTVLIRSLCQGNRLFFENGLACLAGARIEKVRAAVKNLAKDKEQFIAFEKICCMANIPTSMISAIRVVLGYVLDENITIADDQEAFSYRLIEYIMNSGYDKTELLMDYMLALIGTNIRAVDLLN